MLGWCVFSCSLQRDGPVWLVGLMKFASLEADLGGESRPFSLSHSYFLSPSLWKNPDMTEILLVGILCLHSKRNTVVIQVDFAMSNLLILNTWHMSK